MRISFAPALLLASACATARTTPLVDHHQHLLSPAAAELGNRTLPPVALPADLAKVVQERAARWRDQATLAELYTEDALLRSPGSGGWVQGRRQVSEMLAFLFGRPYAITPVSYRVDGGSAQIAGYLTRGEGAAAKPFAYYLLSLVKDRDGAWRIAAETPMFPGPRASEPQTAEQLVALLDEAGIRRAVVLSSAYYFDSPRIGVADPYPQVRAENDWTAAEVARFPDRLVGLCSFNPLADYAVAELERCTGPLRLRGLKLHFGTAGVDLKNPDHAAKVRRVAEAANRLKVPLLVHVRADSTYGREHAELFLDQVAAAAPAVPVQIAHLWGGEQFSDAALAVYAEAVSRGDPRARNLYFDLAEAALVAGKSEEALQKIAARIRQIGLQRILYGSDGPVPESQAPKEAWKTTHALPLTPEELRTIAGNVAPYLR